jgi:very-short-patch-repair endonuclease
VIVEVDGERAHAGRVAFVRDRQRQNALIAAGYLVLRFTWWDITEHPQTEVASIRRTLALRDAR